MRAGVIGLAAPLCRRFGRPLFCTYRTALVWTGVKNMRKKTQAIQLFLVLALAATLAPLSALAQAPQPAGPQGANAAPEMVARVNGEPVTRAEFDRMLASLPESAGQDPDGTTLDRLALRNLINRRLILQEGARRKLIVTDKDLDQAVTSVRRRFKDLKGLGMWMKQQGIDDQSLFETLRSELLAARVRAALVEGVRPTGEQVQEYYAAHQRDMAIGEEVRLRMIAVTSKAAAEEILAALQKGEKFGPLARQRSAGRRAAQGGDTGWVNSETLAPALREAVGKLQAGEAGGPVQKGAEEFLIVGLAGRRPAHAKSLAEAWPA